MNHTLHKPKQSTPCSAVPTQASLLDAEKASVAHPDAFSSYEAASSGQPGGSRVEAGGKALLVHSSSSGNMAGGKQLVVEEESSEDGKAPVEEFGQVSGWTLCAYRSWGMIRWFSHDMRTTRTPDPSADPH